MKINLDCCGITCVIFAYFFIFYIDGTVFYLESLINSQYNGFNSLLFNLLVLMVIWSHLKATFSDPGHLPKNFTQLDPDLLPLTLTNILENALKQSDSTENSSQNIMPEMPNISPATSITLEMEQPKNSETIEKPNNSYQKILKSLVKSCKHCNSLKPPKTHHCSICNRCVARMDHHCPWINNCVGYYNQRPFILFLLYTIIALIYALILILKDSLQIFSNYSRTNPIDMKFVLISIFLMAPKKSFNVCNNNSII